MSTDLHPAQELAELVADLRQLSEAWDGVGVRLVGADHSDPAWPEVELPSGDPTPDTPGPAVPLPPVATQDRPRAAPSLFPEQQARPHTLPPRPRDPERPGRWAGYGVTSEPTAELARVREQAAGCTGCGLHQGRTNLVFGIGDPRAPLAVVGDAPGFHEDRQGEPFVGPAGQMLDRMLENVIGLRRDQVYIMNVLACRPPDDREPALPQVEACRGFFDAQLNIVRPRVILALGLVAARSLLGSDQDIETLRGKWGSYRGIAVMPTFHPAYLLRFPDLKRLTLQDLLALKVRLNEPR